MKVFIHHIYEYEKGVRNLILHTMPAKYKKNVEEKLTKKNIVYLIREINEKRINVFFGDKVCIKLLEKIGCKKLYDFTDEEDFMLGIMLGYDRLKQCERYLRRKKEKLEQLAG